MSGCGQKNRRPGAEARGPSRGENCFKANARKALELISSRRSLKDAAELRQANKSNKSKGFKCLQNQPFRENSTEILSFCATYLCN
jgi:hypothetical protein